MVPMVEMPAQRDNYGGRRTERIRFIVMHYTANDGDNGFSNGRYFQQKLTPPVSCHYFVDDVRIVRTVPDEYVAWHCGAREYLHPTCRNGNSIGVELCDTRKDGSIMATEKTVENAAQLVAALMRRYQIPLENVVRHYDVTAKWCPAYWVNRPRGWQEFLQMVKEGPDVVEQGAIIVDGKTVTVERILKNGTNYVKVRDLARALGLEVGFVGNIATLTTPDRREKE